jgi:type VI secretion system secreted protein VgrG
MSQIPFGKDKLMSLAHDGESGHSNVTSAGQSLVGSSAAGLAAGHVPSFSQARSLGGLKPHVPGVDHFQFISKGKIERRVRITHFTGEERVNGTYAFEIEGWSPFEVDPLATIEDEMIGHPGALLMYEATGAPRVVHGIVTGYQLGDSREQGTPKVKLRLEPRLSLLKLRTHSRIYQDLTVPEIIGSLLREWNVRHTFELTGDYTPRTYATQFQETDYDFVRRIAAREGIFFHFRQAAEEEQEELVFMDDALYRAIPGGLDSRLLMNTGQFGEGGILELGVHRKLTPMAARSGDYDFRNPRLPLRELKAAQHPPGVLGDLGAERFAHYIPRHEAEHEANASAKRREVDAARTLEALQADAIVVDGVSRARRFLPAHSFSVEGHKIASFNREWVVVSVRHEGFTPEYGEASSDEVYRNDFQAAPVETALRMPVQDRKRVVESTQSATVVGADEGEVFTDASGRIKVQFHWDLEGKNDEHSSCWIRVAQPWTGAGFGTQFLPRVGTEVLVSFLDGDPDRPIVMGSVYNGTNPAPFGLPQSRTRSGIRTMSTPGGGGANELSFEDQQGGEQILIKAHRNFDTDVGADHTVTVKGNSTSRVDGHLTENVAGTKTTTVVGGQTTLVTLHKTNQVLGDMIDAVRGNADKRVSGDNNVRVEGVDRHDLASKDELVWGDSVLRVQGHLAAVVGKELAHRSATVHVQGETSAYSTGQTEIVSESAIIFRCGKSSIRLGPEGVEISSPNITVTGDEFSMGMEKALTMVSKQGAMMEGEKLNLSTKKASLNLTDEAHLGGKHVKFSNQPETAEVQPKLHPVTTIRLADEDGTPASNRRFVVVTPHGERSGMLNDLGEAKIEIDSAIAIYFPDVDKARGA